MLEQQVLLRCSSFLIKSPSSLALSCMHFFFVRMHEGPCSGSDLLTDRALIWVVVVFLSSCNVPAQGKVAIAIRKYGFLLLPPLEEEEEWWCLGQPSTQQALISHLDVIYCGLHRENSVYCNRDHNYHRSALSQDLSCVCVCVRVCVCVCVCVSLGGHLCMH